MKPQTWKNKLFLLNSGFNFIVSFIKQCFLWDIHERYFIHGMNDMQTVFLFTQFGNARKINIDYLCMCLIFVGWSDGGTDRELLIIIMKQHTISHPHHQK